MFCSTFHLSFACQRHLTKQGDERAGARQRACLNELYITGRLFESHPTCLIVCVMGSHWHARHLTCTCLIIRTAKVTSRRCAPPPTAEFPGATSSRLSSGPAQQRHPSCVRARSTTGNCDQSKFLAPEGACIGRLPAPLQVHHRIGAKAHRAAPGGWWV
jgi:hypothetical protein